MRRIKAVLAGVGLTLSFSVAAQVADTGWSTTTTGKSNGTTFESKSAPSPTFDGATTQSASTMTLVTVPDQTVVSLAGDLPAHDATVGTLNGSASVSGGAASYEIPVALPPGRTRVST